MDTKQTVLPYWPLWAAAQFASTDEAKKMLTYVHVFQDADTIQIESTDGHRAFRYRIPRPSNFHIDGDELMIAASTIKKQVSYGKYVTVEDPRVDHEITIWGGKRDACERITTYHERKPHGYTYPNINQLWPDSFSNAPESSFAFNTRYIKEIAAVMDKLGSNCIMKFYGNAPTTPWVITSSYEPRFGDHADRPVLEVLIMPVQVRD